MKSVGFLNNFSSKSNLMHELQNVRLYRAIKWKQKETLHKKVWLFYFRDCFVLFYSKDPTGDIIKWPSAATICRVHENHLSMPSDVNSFSLQSDIYESCFGIYESFMLFMKVFMLSMKVFMVFMKDFMVFMLFMKVFQCHSQQH